MPSLWLVASVVDPMRYPREVLDPRPLFRSLTALRWLNVAGVGVALSAVVGAGCGTLFGGAMFSNPAALCTALPTLAVGLAWALLLRWKLTFGKHEVLLGWYLSVPLAIANTSLCAGFLSAHGQGLVASLGSSVFFLPVACTIGVLYWVPALLFVLFAFGAPLMWAQRQARRGLVGEERGELVVGAAVSLLSLVGLALASFRSPSGEENWLRDQFSDFSTPPPDALPRALHLPDSSATWLLAALGLLGASLGAAAVALASRRALARGRFVAQVERGHVAGFRVVEAEQGRTLVRVQGEQGYRSLEEEEILFAIEEQRARAPG